MWLYPRVAGSNWRKIANYDFIATIVSIVIAGVLFYESNIEFDIVFGYVNWFWFSLITYLTLEIPMVFWYFKKYNVWKNMQ